MGFECDYTLAGVLQAVQALAMRVPAGAKPRQARVVLAEWPYVTGVLVKAKSVRGRSRAKIKDKAVSRAATSRALAFGAFGLRQTTIALRGGSAAEATLRRRLSDPGAALQLEAAIGTLAPLRVKPKPAPPLANQTALELPWRLIISPHAGEGWRHANQAVTSPRPSAPSCGTRASSAHASAGKPPIEPPHADPSRTVRAVWATTGPWGKPMQSTFPQGFPRAAAARPGRPFPADAERLRPLPDQPPVGQLLDANYVPQPVDTNLLMLSALGGWLDSRGDWEPPGLDVESWVHRASMGRDHYVRVVYRGVAVPVRPPGGAHQGQRAQVPPGLPGNPAYLRQRMFMVVRERVRNYDDAGQLEPYGPGNQRVKNELPFTQVRMLTTVTPDLSPAGVDRGEGRHGPAAVLAGDRAEAGPGAVPLSHAGDRPRRPQRRVRPATDLHVELARQPAPAG